MGNSISYKLLPTTYTGPLCGTYQPEDDVVGLRERLEKLDPNRDGILTRNEVRKHYRLIKWSQLEKDFKTMYRVWRKIKNNTCKNYCRTNSCRKPTPFTKLTNKVFPRLPTDLTAAAVTKALKPSRTSYGGGMDFFSISYRVYGMTIEFGVTVSFHKNHPVKSYKVVLNGTNAIRVQITHYSGKKTSLTSRINPISKTKFERRGNPTRAKMDQWREPQVISPNYDYSRKED